MLTDGKVSIMKRFTTFKTLNVSQLKSDSSERVLSYHIGTDNCAYVPIKRLEKYPCNINKLYKVCLQNNLGLDYEFLSDENTYVYTKNKGYVKVPYLNLSSLCLDDRGLLCKVVSVNDVNCDPKTEVFDIRTEYNSNFFFQGILMK